MRSYCVYKHTSPSGKSYIGQTFNYEKRCKRHQSNAGNCEERSPAFEAAIKKYGWDAFTHTVLMDGLTIDDANELEEFYIDFIGTLAPDGYNLRTGGANWAPSPETRAKMSAGRKGMVATIETLIKMSASQKGNQYARGSKHSIEANAKKSAALKGNQNCLNYVHSSDTRAKMSEAQKKRRALEVNSNQITEPA